jgi:hypothetical protein
VDFTLALAAAASLDPLGEEWADAQAADACEVPGLLADINSARAAAKAAAARRPNG